MHATGDFVFDTIEKANVQVLEKIEALFLQNLLLRRLICRSCL